jgi:hypothetical protein
MDVKGHIKMKLKDILHKFDIPAAKVVAQESTAAVGNTQEVQTNEGFADAVRMLRLAGLHSRADKLVAEAGIAANQTYGPDGKPLPQGGSAAQPAADATPTPAPTPAAPAAAPAGVVSGSGAPVTSGSGAPVQSGTPAPTADAAAAAKAKLSPEQLKWLGGADPTDPIIMSRLKSAVPDAKPAAPTGATTAPVTQGSATATPITTPAASTPQQGHDAAVASGQPDDSAGPTATAAAPATQAGGSAAQPAAPAAKPKIMAKPDPAVLKQQQDLIAKGAKIKADGVMGPATQAAIKQFGGAAAQPAATPAATGGGAFAGSDPAKIDAEIKRFSAANNMSLQSNKDYVASLEKKKTGGSAQPAAPANPVTGAANAAAAARGMGGRGAPAPAVAKESADLTAMLRIAGLR